jgi:copper(I)-binding protein
MAMGSIIGAAQSRPMRLSRLALSFVTLLLAGAAQAHDYKIGKITVGHPSARFTVAGQTAGGGFLSIDNAGEADRLVGASAAVADRVELHAMRMEGDVMRMRRVDGIDVPANGHVEMGPGGYHLMFMGLKAPLKVGEKFPMKLKFRKAGEVTVEVHVEAPAPGRDEHKH